MATKKSKNKVQIRVGDKRKKIDYAAHLKTLKEEGVEGLFIFAVRGNGKFMTIADEVTIWDIKQLHKWLSEQLPLIILMGGEMLNKLGAVVGSNEKAAEH